MDLPEDQIGIRTGDLCPPHFLPKDVGDFQVEEERQRVEFIRTVSPLTGLRRMEGTNHLTPTLASTTITLNGLGPRAKGLHYR